MKTMNPALDRRVQCGKTTILILLFIAEVRKLLCTFQSIVNLISILCFWQNQCLVKVPTKYTLAIEYKNVVPYKEVMAVLKFLQKHLIESGELDSS